MIEFPEDFQPNAATVRQIDNGFVQEYVGGGSLRIDRPGNRWEIELSFPIRSGADARVAMARFARAKSEGLRVEFPLQGVDQGNPGLPVVDGTTSAGRVLKLKTMIAGYQAKEGYWLTLIDAGGTRYLHQISALATVDGAGKVELSVEPPLRVIPADGWQVLIAKPEVEGLVLSAVEWGLAPGEFNTGISVTLREAA
jgi:hypothetical protein